MADFTIAAPDPSTVVDWDDLAFASTPGRLNVALYPKRYYRVAPGASVILTITAEGTEGPNDVDLPDGELFHWGWAVRGDGPAPLLAPAAGQTSKATIAFDAVRNRGLWVARAWRRFHGVVMVGMCVEATP